MELKSGQPQKKIVSLLGRDEAPAMVQTRWYFSELCNDFIDVDFFDMAEDSEVHCYGDVLSWCMSVLENSPTARLMLREACDKDWKITIEDLNGGEYCVDVEQKLLILDNNSLVPSALGRSGYFRNMTIVTLTKALRDIWQEKRHGGFDEHYSPEYVLLMERVRAADLDVLSVMVAWELRSEEFPEIWRHIIGSDIGDMAMTFSGYLERDPSSAYSGMALRAAFKQWFRDEGRLHSCDHDTLEYLDDVLASSIDASETFGKKRPGKMNVEVLSCLPDKTAYLQGMGGEILADPSYSSVDDEINQTHLFHIMYDLEAIIVENVPFRDADLAQKIFPVERD